MEYKKENYLTGRHSFYEYINNVVVVIFLFNEPYVISRKNSHVCSPSPLISACNFLHCHTSDSWDHWKIWRKTFYHFSVIYHNKCKTISAQGENEMDRYKSVWHNSSPLSHDVSAKVSSRVVLKSRSQVKLKWTYLNTFCRKQFFIMLEDNLKLLYLLS